MLTLLTSLALSGTAAAAAPSALPLSLDLELANLAANAPLSVAPQDESEGSPFSYTYIEGGAVKYDIDSLSGVDDEADTYYGRAQLGLFKVLYIFAGYENQSIDFQDTSTDIIRLGAGAHFNVMPELDLVGDIAWLYSDISSDLSTLDDTTNGYEIRAGARWMPVDWSGGGLEINGDALWIDLENRLASDDSDFGWELGARVHFLEFFSIGAGYTMIGDDDAGIVNARVSF